jgi:site-specific DNA-cytosine methylase
MSEQVILTDLFNATSLPDLAVGVAPCSLPNGPRTDLFGRAVARASPSAQPVQGGGVTDERHLWPTWFNLIRECRPDVIFGEQVEAAINHGWLDLVQADLEGEGYACGAVGLPAGGVGAPHIRQRLWFVADAQSVGRSIQHTSHNGSANAPSNTFANANDSVADQRRSDIGELGIAQSAGRRTGGEY